MNHDIFDENRFTEICFGREVVFRRIPAAGQLALAQDAIALLPRLAALGVPLREGYALAHNCAALSYALCGDDRPVQPDEMLECFTLGQIAELAARYWAHDDLPFDENWDEVGVVPDLVPDETGGV